MNTNQRPAPSWLRRRYERDGVRYLWQLLGAGVAWVLFEQTINAAIAVTYLERGWTEYFGILAMFWIGAAIALPVTTVRWRRRSEPTFRWARGERGTDLALEAWATTADTAVRWPLGGFVASTPLWIPAAFLTAELFDSGIASVPVWLIAVFLVQSYATCVAMFLLQFGLRPVCAEIAAELPDDAPVGRARFGVRAQVAAALAIAASSCAGTVGALTTVPEDPLAAFALGMVSIVVFLVTFGLLLVPPGTNAIVGPIADLAEASRRIASGDLAVAVEVSSDDELGQLAQSFNVMVKRLHDHDKQLNASRVRIVAAADAARREVERDLHDGAQQQLVLVNLKLGELTEMVADDPAARGLATEIRGDLDEALHDLRDLARGIYPAALESGGLRAGLGDAIDRAAIRTTLDADGTGRYPPVLENAIYFCCLEALQNAAKHAGTSATAGIRIFADDDALHFEVADDGSGYDPSTTTASNGQQNMIDRIGAVGGALRITSAPGRGTTVSGSVPLTRASSAR